MMCESRAHLRDCNRLCSRLTIPLVLSFFWLLVDGAGTNERARELASAYFHCIHCCAYGLPRKFPRSPSYLHALTRTQIHACTRARTLSLLTHTGAIGALSIRGHLLEIKSSHSHHSTSTPHLDLQTSAFSSRGTFALLRSRKTSHQGARRNLRVCTWGR
jgi:hypothetical protein